MPRYNSTARKRFCFSISNAHRTAIELFAEDHGLDISEAMDRIIHEGLPAAEEIELEKKIDAVKDRNLDSQEFGREMTRLYRRTSGAE